jgi:transposase
LDIITAYQELGSYRAAAKACGTTHKTVTRVVAKHAAGQAGFARAPRPSNYDMVREVVVAKVETTHGRITAKRLLPATRAAGYEGSARNFRRLVAEVKAAWRAEHGRGRRPAVWTPGEHLVIDWGVLAGLHVFCAVLAHSRVRFVRFADNERAETTLAMLAECFEGLGGVPKVVLADRMGCLKGGVVADVVVPTPDYVRFAAHYRFRPDFCQGGDPASKGIVENLVGYAKTDLMIGLGLTDGVTAGRAGDGRPVDLAWVNAVAKLWCYEINQIEHSQICAIPDERLTVERELLTALPSLRPSIGRRVTRKVDSLSCVRFCSARYSVPTRHRGTVVELVAVDGRLDVIVPGTGELLATHELVAPGESSVLDEHYGGPRPASPPRAFRPKTLAESNFIALGPVAEAWLRGAAAAGNTRLGPELGQLVDLAAAHGKEPLIAALTRAVAFSRWHAADVASILAAGAGVAEMTPAGDALLVELPVTNTRDLHAYSLEALAGSDR